jgi:hypothetical protein
MDSPKQQKTVLNRRRPPCARTQSSLGKFAKDLPVEPPRGVQWWLPFTHPRRRATMYSNHSIRVPDHLVTWFAPDLSPPANVAPVPAGKIDPQPYALGVEAGRQWAITLATFEMLQVLRDETDENRAPLFRNGFVDGALAFFHEMATEAMEMPRLSADDVRLKAAS